MNTPQGTPEEKNEICEKAFESIYPSCDRKDENSLESLKDILGNDIADRIKNFNRYNKPVLFISDNISLIRGAVSYLWYTHGQGMSPLVLDCLGLEKNEVSTKVKGDWIESAFENREFYTELGGMLFLEGLNLHEDILRQLLSIVKGNKGCSYIRHELKTGIMKEEKNFGILVIGMDKTGDLSQGFLDQFEVINLESEKQEKDFSVSTPENTNYNWVIEGDKVFSNGQIVKLTDIKLKLFKCLHSKKGKNVYNKTLEKCWDTKPRYENFLVDTMNELEHTLKKELKQSEKIIESKTKGRKIEAYKLPS